MLLYKFDQNTKLAYMNYKLGIPLLAMSLHIIHPLEDKLIRSFIVFHYVFSRTFLRQHMTIWQTVYSLCLLPHNHKLCQHHCVYLYFSMFDLQRLIPVRSLFRHFQCNHGVSQLGPTSSDGMDLSLCGTDSR